nr:immunoglobulin light chain junction region [Macaca mulatta]
DYYCSVWDSSLSGGLF